MPPGALSANADGSSRAPKATGPRGEVVDQLGLATWYEMGKYTANGERFDPRGMTAAHRKLPFGTWVLVRRQDTGRAVRVRINDRGPWGNSRKIIDLSRGAAEALDMIAAGSVPVTLTIVSGP